MACVKYSMRAKEEGVRVCYAAGFGPSDTTMTTWPSCTLWLITVPFGTVSEYSSRYPAL